MRIALDVAEGRRAGAGAHRVVVPAARCLPGLWIVMGIGSRSSHAMRGRCCVVNSGRIKHTLLTSFRGSDTVLGAEVHLLWPAAAEAGRCPLP